MTHYVKRKVTVRSGPGRNYRAVAHLLRGESVQVSEVRNGWAQISPRQWVSAEYLTSNLSDQQRAGVSEYQEPDAVHGRLYGFGIGSYGLTTTHTNWLDDHIVPLIIHGGSVSVVGEASRSGSDEDNEELSEKRAEAVVAYLRRAISRQARASGHHGFRVTSVVGEGERPAETAGLIDGDENSYYRAVRVIAWSYPIRPSVRAGGQRPTNRFRHVVVSRTWTSVGSSTPTTGNPYHDGEAGVGLGQFINQLIAAIQRGGSDERTYSQVPMDHVVTRVSESYISRDIGAPPVVTRSSTRVIRYTYGPRSRNVVVHRVLSAPSSAGPYAGTRSERNVYPRDLVWDHVTHPNQTVF